MSFTKTTGDTGKNVSHRGTENTEGEITNRKNSSLMKGVGVQVVHCRKAEAYCFPAKENNKQNSL